MTYDVSRLAAILVATNLSATGGAAAIGFSGNVSEREGAMTNDRDEPTRADPGGHAAGREKPAPSFRAWVVTILAAALLSAGATLLLGGSDLADTPSAGAGRGCDTGCCGHAGR
jgi:phosphate/sulfate permease